MDRSDHFEEALRERGIQPEWVDRALNDPDSIEDREDGTRHFIRRIPEFEDRSLRVVVNVKASPPRLITTFFDRRLRKEK